MLAAAAAVLAAQDTRTSAASRALQLQAAASDDAPTREVARRLNDRFAHGSSYNSTNLGVTVHGFDAISLRDEEMREWIFLDAPAAKSQFAPIVSASLINGRVPYLFLGNEEHLAVPGGEDPRSEALLTAGHAGVIYSPAAVEASLLCSYERDGDSMNVAVACDDAAGAGASSCTPGCVGTYNLTCLTSGTCIQSKEPGMRGSCPAGSAGLTCLECDTQCSWAAGTLQAMLRSHEARVANYTAGCRAGGDCQCIANGSCCAYGGADPCYLYNELVLSLSSLAPLVPGAVEA
eukprot:6621269-Prymnesium_polylepis.1